MSKKDFIALADMIRRHNSQHDPSSMFPSTRYFEQDQIEMLADFCASQNPRFNRERWLGYIAGTNGKNGGKVKA